VDAMDFDDSLPTACGCCANSGDPGVVPGAVHARARGRYQDTNALRPKSWIAGRKHGNLMVVGDDFQSIYSWRADYRT